MILRVAFRNIFRQKKRSFLLVGAIAFGMLMITIMNSLTAGIVKNIQENFTHALGGHIFIMGQEYPQGGQLIYKIRDQQKLNSLLVDNRASIKSITKRSQATPSLIFASKQTSHLFYGVDFNEEDLLANLLITEGSLADVLVDEDALLLPEAVGKRLGVEPGETILVKLPTLTGQQNVGEFKVAAFIEDQEFLGVSAAYVHRSALNKLLGIEAEEYQIVNLFVEDLASVEVLADIFEKGLRTEEEIKELAEKEESGLASAGSMADILGLALGGEEITPWQGTRFKVTNIHQIMEPVKLLVGVLNKVGKVIFLILLLVTMIGITNTFRMIMLERSKEIGTMRAFGMHKNQVKHIFLMEAIFLGLLGSGGGIAISLFLSTLLSKIHFAAAPGIQLFLEQGKLGFVYSWSGIIFNLVLVMVISLLAAYLPAKAAAKMSPIKALGSHS